MKRQSRHDDNKDDMRRRSAAAQKAHECLRDVDFPTSRDALVEKARVNDPDNPDVVAVLEHIPDREYESLEDVEEALASAL